MADAALTAATPAASPAATAAGSSWHLWKEGGVGFRDLLDTINPLQHLPLVGSVYRWATGDEPGNVARVAGDTLYGGPLGFLAGLFGAATKDSAGHDLGEQLLTAVLGPADKTGAAVATAIVHPNNDPAWLATFPTAPSAATTAAAGSPTPPAMAAACPPAAGAAVTVPRDAPAMPPSRTAAAAPRDPAQEFLAQNAALQRRAIGPAPGAAVSNRVVPLTLTGGTLPPARPGAAAVRPVDAPAIHKDAAVEDLPGNAPVDVSQKMLDALDKYMKMQQAHDPKAEARQIDLVQ